MNEYDKFKHDKKSDDKSPPESVYWWVFGRKGGNTREKIIYLLKDRPYNAHQISEILEMSYRNIKHHLKVLQNATLVIKNDQKYGKMYLLSPYFDFKIFEEVCKKVASE
ncbi:MAG: winged helix-turn-helix domain-containing protein [Candidatus Helarchaeota archaeon]